MKVLFFILQALDIIDEVGSILHLKYSRLKPPVFSEKDIKLIEVKAFCTVFTRNNIQSKQILIFPLLDFNGLQSKAIPAYRLAMSANILLCRWLQPVASSIWILHLSMTVFLFHLHPKCNIILMVIQ